MNITSTDHVAVRSFREFIEKHLPEALAQVVGVTDYSAEPTGPGKGRIAMTLLRDEDQVRLVFENLLFPRADGIFEVEDSEHAVVMTASGNNLAEAEIKVVGEQLLDEIAPRLVAPPAEIAWEESLLRAWFPLDRWFHTFFTESPTCHWLDNTNPIGRITHPRRIMIQGEDTDWHPSYLGRVCPFETPEGPNHGRIFSLALGADVSDGRIIPAADLEEGALGFTANLVPLLCHNDTVRQGFGINMMRQWLPQEQPEAALVQSGHEPADGSVWLGRNFLTAFIHWKGLTFEDGLVMSASAAARLGSPNPLEVGDKLSNRHGAKGVVAAILPDDEMPRLPDGRPVELIYDCASVISRLNFGQLLEATLGLVAEKTGQPIIAPPFRRWSQEELHRLLREAGLPESGQLLLQEGETGNPLEEPSTVGYVYWGKTIHLAKDKIQAVGMRFGKLEYLALRSAEALETIRDVYIRTWEQEGGGGLSATLAQGFLQEPLSPPSFLFTQAQAALRVAMLELTWQQNEAVISWVKPTQEDLVFAEAIPHPWCPTRQLTHLGAWQGEAYERVLAANARLAQLQQSNTPATMLARALAVLYSAVEDLLAELTEANPVEMATRMLFSGRAALSPDPSLALGEVGLPPDLAWKLYASLLAGKLDAKAISSRSTKACKVLEQLLQESMVVINRAPTTEVTSITAFTPVLRDGFTLRLHPAYCRLFNGDFDGDQAAVWLPITQQAQQEAKERLSLTGHLQRDPSVVVSHLAPSGSPLAGLAFLLEHPAGTAALQQVWPASVPLPEAPLTRQGLIVRLLELYNMCSAESLLTIVGELYRLGITWASRSGMSYSPFLGEGVQLPAPPTTDYVASWYAYAGLVETAITAQAEQDATLRAPFRLINSGARGSVRHLRALKGPWGVESPHDANPPIKHGLQEGLPAAEVWQMAEYGFAALHRLDVMLHKPWQPSLPAGASLLKRALLSSEPYKVLAEAAELNERDPLTDLDVRLWVGLPPN